MAQYDALVAKVEAFAARVAARHPAGLTCHLGCSRCCHQHLSVLEVEWRRIRAAAAALPEEARAAIAARVRAGADDPRCPLLDDAGACRVYGARPMICRTHGLPIRVAMGVDAPPQRDVCPLNFTGSPGLAALDEDVILDVEHLNALLGLIDGLEGSGTGARVDLLAGLAALLDEGY